MEGTTCMELALEGERLCKTGDFKAGVAFFEAAIKEGTNDQRTLSAIYSQLGNAYFYLENYEKALEYHKLDVSTTKSIHDEVAEAKASGNLGNTLKMLDKFDEAAIHCRRHLEISKNLNDKVGEGRALYNLGNVYHTKGKKMLQMDRQNPGELPEEIKSCLLRAVEYYDANLKVAQELNDEAAMGRAYGNLGNTHYLIGNFDQAVHNHNKRLDIARKFGDRAAERRAQCNLGNANVFLGNFQEALENYFQTLNLAQELDDKAVEAQSFYSLANTYTLLRDYASAIKYHLLYLDMVRKLHDRLGEGRACWSLVNIYQLVDDHQSALEYAKKHLDIAKELGDDAGIESAQINIDEIQSILINKQSHSNQVNHQAEGNVFTISGALIPQARSSSIDHTTSHQTTKNKRFSIERLNLFRLTPDRRQEQEQRRFKKQLNSAFDNGEIAGSKQNSMAPGQERMDKSPSSERLLDMIAHFQSGRIDDQRCEIIQNTLDSHQESAPKNDKENFGPSSRSTSSAAKTYRKSSLANFPTTQTDLAKQMARRPTVSAQHRDELFDLIAGAQGQRMDEQRASLPAFNVANGTQLNGPVTSQGLLNKTNQASNPSKLPPKLTGGAGEHGSFNQVQGQSEQKKTQGSSNKPHLSRRYQSLAVDPQSKEEGGFLDLLMKHQSTRLDDQRAAIPKSTTRTLEKLPSQDKLGDLRKTTVVEEASTKVGRFNKRSSSVCLSGLSNSGESQPSFSNRSGHRGKETKGETDDFYNLIMRFQSDRIDDQRSALPPSSDHQMNMDKRNPPKT